MILEFVYMLQLQLQLQFINKTVELRDLWTCLHKLLIIAQTEKKKNQW